MEQNNKIKFVNYYYTFKEMIDSMSKTIDNINNIVKGQTELVEYLNKSEKKNDFKEFIAQLEESNKEYEKQLPILQYRLDLAMQIDKEELNSNDRLRFMSMLFEIFGLCNKEAKSLEERIANQEEVSEVEISNKGE